MIAKGMDGQVAHAATKATTPIWTNGKDTRAGTVKSNDAFKEISIRTVSVDDVGK
jgi:hypothetical protein